MPVNEGHKISCDGCGKVGLDVGNRYKCSVCDDFDLCSSCFKSKFTGGNHNASHKMVDIWFSFTSDRVKIRN